MTIPLVHDMHEQVPRWVDIRVDDSIKPLQAVRRNQSDMELMSLKTSNITTLDMISSSSLPALDASKHPHPGSREPSAKHLVRTS